KSRLAPRLRLIRSLRAGAVAYRAVVWLSLVCFVAVAGGVPLPTGVPSAGGPFPCQGHRCGCQSAERCWKACCCFSPAEKVAWAKKHGVTPPAAVVAAAEKERSAPPRRACCAARQAAKQGAHTCAGGRCSHASRPTGDEAVHRPADDDSSA